MQAEASAALELDPHDMRACHLQALALLHMHKPRRGTQELLRCIAAADAIVTAAPHDDAVALAYEHSEAMQDTLRQLRGSSAGDSQEGGRSVGSGSAGGAAAAPTDPVEALLQRERGERRKKRKRRQARRKKLKDKRREMGLGH